MVVTSHFPVQFHPWNKKRGVYLTFDKHLACERSKNPNFIIIPSQAHIVETNMCHLFSLLLLLILGDQGESQA